jgi:hypothetical protein
VLQVRECGACLLCIEKFTSTKINYESRGRAIAREHLTANKIWENGFSR